MSACLLLSLLLTTPLLASTSSKVFPGKTTSSDGDCDANKLELNIQRRMHLILRRAYANITSKEHKKRMQKIYEINRKKIKNMKLRQTCTEQPEEILLTLLVELKNPMIREQVILGIRDLVSSDDPTDFLKKLINILQQTAEESDGNDYIAATGAAAVGGILLLSAAGITLPFISFYWGEPWLTSWLG